MSSTLHAHVLSLVGLPFIVGPFAFVCTEVHFTAGAAIAMRESVSPRIISILGREFMAVFAMCLAMLHACWAHAAMRINVWRNTLKVRRIYASTDTTKVIDFIFGCDNKDEQSVRNALCCMVAPIEPEVSITIMADSGSPQPTRCPVVSNKRIDLYLTKKANQDLGVYWKSVRIVENHLSLLFRFDGMGFRGLTHREALSF